LGNPKTTIELNGKQYDARTGKIISESSHNSSPNIVVQPKPGQVVDGFTRRPTTASENLAKQKSARASVNHAKRPVFKSKTLMRPSVKKPAQIKNDIQKQKYIPKPSHTTAVRMSRAETTPKSTMVSRFGLDSMQSSVKKSIQHLPVVSAPSNVGLVKSAENELEKFENALKNAGSQIQHLEQEVVRKVPILQRIGFKNKFANIASLSFGVLLLVGFFAYQNAASISMRVAASRIGIDAKMPAYTPAGYGPSKKISASDGRVSISFISNTDDKSYTLSQQASNWNSSALLANHVQKRTCPTCFQTWQDGGKTVYIYDNSNASWVDGGIWYQIEGNASLTSDQLLRLANSL
jgi:hypothetical protein